MEILNDIVDVNKKTMQKTINSLKTGWPIIFTGVVYGALNLVVFTLLGRLFVGPLAILGGLVSAMVSATIISNYLYLLLNVVKYGKITIQDFKDGFTAFSRKVYSVFFYIWIAGMLLEVLSGILGGGVFLLIGFAAFVIFNPILETLYLKHYDGLGSLTYCPEFMKDNWLNWLIPNLLIQGLIFIFTGTVILNIFTISMGSVFTLNPVTIGLHLISQLLFSFLMVYRAHLFELLSTSTRRKRMFMSKF